MNHQAAVPLKVAEYLGISQHPPYEEHPTITETFTPGKGWKRVSGRQRISYNKCRQLKADGVTAIAVGYFGRTIDFSINEVQHITSIFRVVQ